MFYRQHTICTRQFKNFKRSSYRRYKISQEITVKTKEQLQKSAGKTLSEVLNEQVGITINGANNNLGTNQTLYMRGAHAANTLILVDGVPVYDASGETNQFDISNFSLYNIERIEIMKGAQSTLYGSDAVAGVINLITKKGGEKPINFNAIFSAGSYNTYKGSVALSGNKKGQTYFLSYSKIDSKGFSSAYDSTGKQNFDKDGFKQDVLQGNYGFTLFKKLETRIYGKYNINKADIDAGAFADDKDYTYEYKDLQTGVSLNYPFQKNSIKFNYNYNRYQRNYLDDSLSVGGFAKYQRGNYIGKSHFAEVYGNFKPCNSVELLAGIDYRGNATSQDYFYFPNYGFLSPSLSSDTTKTDQVSAYTSVIVKFKNGFNTELGGRWNYHSIYGSNFTYSFNPSCLIKNKFKIFANISSAYRVPSLYQLYSEFGNKNLQPETTTGVEGGIQFFSQNFTARGVLFYRNTKNVFAFYTDPVTYVSKYINENKQKDNGIEADVSWHSDKINVSANYTYVDGKINTKDFSGRDTAYNNLYRRPANTFNFSIGYQVCKDLFVSSHLKTVSKFYEGQYAAAPYTMNGFYTLDIYGEYKFNKSCKVFIDLQNITDQKYFDIRGFNSKRFNFNAGININL
jgi:vitamin B12 transporter